MGVDIDLKLPSNVRLDAASEVIGAAMGCLKIKKKLESSTTSNTWYCQVSGITTTGLVTQPECCYIDVVTDYPLLHEIKQDNNPNWGEEKLHWLWHFEYGRDGCRGAMPRSRAKNIAIGKKLVEFFGGTLIPNDCDGRTLLKLPHNPDEINCPEDGKPWQDLQQRIYDVQPITIDDLIYAEQFASYKTDGLKALKAEMEAPAKFKEFKLKVEA